VIIRTVDYQIKSSVFVSLENFNSKEERDSFNPNPLWDAKTGRLKKVKEIY